VSARTDAFQNRTEAKSAFPQRIIRWRAKGFAKFWSSEREMTRRIHGLAAVDYDLEKVLAASQDNGSNSVIA
jgi:hypothetical protein